MHVGAESRPEARCTVGGTIKKWLYTLLVGFSVRPKSHFFTSLTVPAFISLRLLSPLKVVA